MTFEGVEKKTLLFHYKGMFENGETFTDSTNGEPMKHVLGQFGIMPELEEALARMQPGDECVVNVGKAYGEYDESAVRTRILRYTIADGDKLEQGQEIMWTSPNNPLKPIPARIVRADDYTFDIDFNHPLAGKSITYWIKLVSAE